MRALTRPEGSSAVERVTVSGWWTFSAVACLNQVSNWVKGEASSWEISREPFVYCWAWGESFVPPGAKMCLETIVRADVGGMMMVVRWDGLRSGRSRRFIGRTDEVAGCV